MSDEALLQFLSLSLDNLSCGQLSDLLTDVLETCGFKAFAMICMALRDGPLSDYVMLGHYDDEWADIYSSNDYAFVDPVARYVRKSTGPFRWSEALERFREVASFGKMQRMMEDAARHGLEDGYVFPVHADRGLVGYLSVGGPSRDLSRRQLALLDAAAKRSFWAALRACRPKVAEQLSNFVNVQLTRREMEALSRLADGMTSNEIGQALGISSNTVDWYMNGIQDKLGAKNRHHAVAIAFRLGLIN